jgi:hypothetical protein
MIRNFTIRDGVIFGFPEEIDLRGDCELSAVTRIVGPHSAIEMEWKIIGTNEILRIRFTGVENFEVRRRDEGYPFESAVTLGVSGFCRQFDNAEADFFVEPSDEMAYLAFVMDDKSAFLIKADAGQMQRS